MASISTSICKSKYFLLLTYLAVVLGNNSSRGEDQSLSSPPLQAIDLCQRIEGRKRRALVKLGVCLAFGGLLYRWATFKTRTSFSASSMQCSPTEVNVHQHGATLPSLLAAGLSSLAIGAAVVSRLLGLLFLFWWQTFVCGVIFLVACCYSVFAFVFGSCCRSNALVIFMELFIL